MMPTADALALEFSQSLHAHLAPEQMRQVVERNRSVTAPGVWHPHDFCDANVVLYEVFLRHGMDAATEDGMKRHRHLWD